jgi:hypothetical protein
MCRAEKTCEPACFSEHNDSWEFILKQLDNIRTKILIVANNSSCSHNNCVLEIN